MSLESRGAGFAGTTGYATAREVAANCRMLQKLMVAAFPEVGDAPVRLADERDTWSVSVFSQSDEDGLLLRVFDLVGPGGRTLVDIGAGTGLMGNSANLLLHHGWTGHLFDAESKRLLVYEALLRGRVETRWRLPSRTGIMLTAENAAEVVRRAGLPDRVDLVSVDIDGIDYWVAEQVCRVARPRVLVVEFQQCFGRDEAVTVPRDWQPDPSSDRWYFGASLAAFAVLARRHGLALAAISSGGFNAVFVDREEMAGRIQEIGVADALADISSSPDLRERRSRLLDLPWESIDGARLEGASR